jgi:YVTN family beta-propeller protein
MPNWLRRFLSPASVSFCLGLVAASAAAQDAYLTNFTANTISVVDMTTGDITATINVGASPEGIAVTPDGTKILFTTRNETGAESPVGFVNVLDRASNTVSSVIDVGVGPTSIAITPDGTKAYVALDNGNSTPNLWVLDVATGAVLDMIDVGTFPFQVVITPDGTQAYVTNIETAVVTVVAIGTDAVPTTIPVGNLPEGIAITPDGTAAYAVNLMDDTVSVIDTASNRVTNTIPVGKSPFLDAVSPNGLQLYVANSGDGTVSVIDIATGTVTTTIPVGKAPGSVGFSPDGTVAYVANFADNTVSVIETADSAVTATLPIGIGPTPVGNFVAPTLATPASADLASAVLPGGRSVEIPTVATVFATLVNLTPNTVDNCEIQLPASTPSGLSLQFQTTNPDTNALTGTPDTPVTIPVLGAQSFVLSFSAAAPLTVSGLALVYACLDVAQAPVTTGVNTVDLLFSSTPIPDIIALSATATNDGTIHVPDGGSAAFAVATIDAGAAGSITVSTDTGSATLPLTVSLCQTNPANGTCLAPPSSTVTLNFGAEATPTFSFFATASAVIAFSPGASRIFVQFEDSTGVSHGSTSVAVETD